MTVLQTHCPACGRALSLPESMLGQQVRCPICNHVFPAAEQTAPPPAAVQPNASPSAPRFDREEPPARPRRQVVGVSDPAMAETMLAVLEHNGVVRAMVVHGHDGMDELTTTTTSTVWDMTGGAFAHKRTYEVDPAELGLNSAGLDQLRGADPETNAKLARRVLDGELGPHRDIVLLNAAAGLVVAGYTRDLNEGVHRAAHVIDGGDARRVLENLVSVSQAAWDARGTLGVDRGAPVGLTDIALTFELDTDADAATVQRLVEMSERFCVIYQTLRGPLRLTVTHRTAVGA